jgi:membrane-associated phospholipid phosphatase
VGDKKEEGQAKTESFDYKQTLFFSILFPAIFLVAILICCITYRIIPGPEFLILVFLVYAAVNKRTGRFVKDWLPFLTIFISYELLYGLMGTYAPANLHNGPYNLEIWLFHTAPSITILTIKSPILDIATAVFYSTHFFAPTIFAFALWRESPKNYWKYTIAFALCTYAALITFLFYPVAPPWWHMNTAFNPSYVGPEIVRALTQQIDPGIGFPVFRTLFDWLGSDQFAAFPSLHSALPFLISLFAIRVWGKRGIISLILPVGVWFSVVYLGEHYVVDIFGGIAYATIAYLMVEYGLPLAAKHIGFLRKHVPPALLTKSQPMPRKANNKE